MRWLSGCAAPIASRISSRVAAIYAVLAAGASGVTRARRGRSRRRGSLAGVSDLTTIVEIREIEMDAEMLEDVASLRAGGADAET